MSAEMTAAPGYENDNYMKNCEVLKTAWEWKLKRETGHYILHTYCDYMFFDSDTEGSVCLMLTWAFL